MAEAKIKKQFYLGTGRRKTSVARVRMAEGSGKIVINGRDLHYFTEDKDRAAVLGPMEVTNIQARVDIFVNVRGGGLSGQAGAVCQGVARAIKKMFGLTTPTAPAAPAVAAAPGEVPAAPVNDMGKSLRDSGFLTRDGRMKERKKYGRKGARKSFQFSKR